MTERVLDQVAVGVSYGLGESCTGHFSRGAVEGLSARQLVASVIECRQERGPAARTAQVLGDVLRSSRQVNVELAPGSGASTGRPIGLDDVVVQRRPGSGEHSDPEEFTILISESYRGGV